MPIYLDNSATTRSCDAAIAAMEQSMREDYFNPSALYGPALKTEKMMRACREEILKAVRAPAGSTVVFTSGGTEADNLAILGRTIKAHGAGRILYSAGEHPAVKEACLATGLKAVEMPYDKNGVVDVAALPELLTPDTVLICCMQVNNETGAVQPLKEISDLRKKMAPAAHFHVDGVQGFLRLPFDMAGIGADTYALSGHKIHAPKGIGALVMGPNVSLSPRQIGGGQENALRSGTENTPGIAGLLAAIRHYPEENHMRETKLLLWQKIREAVPGAVVNGPSPDSAAAAPHILNVSLPPVRSETMLHALEGEGIYIGMGSACSSRKQKVSPVLKAMHTPQKQAESALRFSLCPDNTPEEMEQTAQAIARQYTILSKFQRR
ncbi:MAG: cysteine desulfurase [Clostridia bacterium]|nr:cysteine desulfurase [Clostridia bacterium]